MREKMALSVQDLNRPLLDKRHLLCQPAAALSNSLRRSSQPLCSLLQDRTILQNHPCNEKTHKTLLLQQMTSYRHVEGFTAANTFHRDDVSSPEETVQGWQ